MEKIFEDKEFHGNVSFFKGIGSWARGNPTNLTWNTSFINFFMASGIGGVSVYDNLNQLVIGGNSADTFGTAIANRSILQFTNGLATNSWTGNYLVACEGQLNFNGDTLALASDYISGLRAVIVPDGGSAVIPTIKNVLSGFNKWASGLLTITNYYGFYSDPDDKHANTTLTNSWHFYGKGDHPTYLGGNLEVVGYINNSPTNTESYDLSNAAPFIADLIAAFGTDAPDGFMGIIKDSTTNRRWLATRDYSGTWAHIELTSTPVS